MKFHFLLILFLITSVSSCKSSSKNISSAKNNRFNFEKDLLLVQFDCKTDVDDIHSVAALATLLSNSDYTKINYHAVAGTYGTQKGLYVPANDLFKMAFNSNWSDAHTNWKKALQEVKAKALNTLSSGGSIWIAEAGQSDFSAALVKELKQALPEHNLSKKIHVVQHSDWNEKVTSSESIPFLKAQIDYRKIPDGNTLDNGTPGFLSPDYREWKSKIRDKRLQRIWQYAIAIGNQYNGQEGRYNNEAINAGGLDFSDISEVCYILNISDLRDSEAFFELFGY